MNGGNRVRRRTARIFGLTAICLAAVPGITGAQAATTVTVAPSDTPSTGNCYPFGLGGDDLSEGPWTPYAAFFYKNLPPFELAPNTAISFDLNGDK